MEVYNCEYYMREDNQQMIKRILTKFYIKAIESKLEEFTYCNLKTDFDEIEKLDPKVLVEKRAQLKILIESEKKIDNESTFSIFALIVASVTLFLTYFGETGAETFAPLLLYIVLPIFILIYSVWRFAARPIINTQSAARIVAYELQLEHIEKTILEIKEKSEQDKELNTKKNKTEDEKYISGKGIMLISLITYFIVKNKSL